MRQHPRPLTQAVRRALAAASLIGTAALVAGCSAPPWLEPGAVPTPSATATATGAATGAAVAPVAPVAPVQNDLAAGSATRTIDVGAITLTIDYWSTLPIDEWTPSANKPLTFAVHATITPDDGQKVYLSRVTAIPVVSAPDGPPQAVEPIVDAATVVPGYLVLDPYSYSQTFIVPEIDPAADRLELTMRYELLQQSTPTSADYAKQTAVDTLTIAIAPEL